MIYLYLDQNTIKLFSLSKTLLGQYNISFFEKNHSNNLLENGQVVNIDILASTIKEALTSATPSPITEKEITLILPQESFSFGRYSIPVDIASSAIEPFVKDKIRADLNFDLDNSYFDFLITTKDNESTVFVYAFKNNNFVKFKEVFDLLQLQIKALYPDSLGYYKLFEKTLRADKKENIVYGYLSATDAFCYLFDYLGLLKDTRYQLDSPDKDGLKKVIDNIKSENINLNRLILSGDIGSIRQDLFTKDVGVWTNPLDKIIQNFYQSYLKLLIPDDASKLNFLHYDVCLGCFIFSQENESFSLLKNKRTLSKSIPTKSDKSGPKVNFSITKHKTLVSFMVSFLLSLTVIFIGLKLTSAKLPSISLPVFKSAPTVTPTPRPEPTVTPTPTLTRADIKIKVLNGTGVAGKAGEIRDILQELGYNEVLTDNADSYDYLKTEISVKTDKKEFADMVKNDLKKYVNIATINELDDEETADLTITIGKDFE